MQLRWKNINRPLKEITLTWSIILWKLIKISSSDGIIAIMFPEKYASKLSWGKVFGFDSVSIMWLILLWINCVIWNIHSIKWWYQFWYHSMIMYDVVSWLMVCILIISLPLICNAKNNSLPNQKFLLFVAKLFTVHALLQSSWIYCIGLKIIRFKTSYLWECILI